MKKTTVTLDDEITDKLRLIKIKSKVKNLSEVIRNLLKNQKEKIQ